MKKVNKVFMTALSCLLAATYVLPVSAQDEVEKKESVYTVLNADGSVKSITVSDTLHSDSGFNNYMDTSDLKDVENLKSDDAINSTSGGYIWNTSDKDIYYQGTSTKDLPLTVKITYTLDGKEITSDDLVGESGHLVINVKVTNSSKQTYTANNKTYNLVTPFVTGLVAMLDDDKFSNVSVNSGTVTSDSSHSIIASVMVPGLKSGLKQVLDSDLMHKMEDYLIDEISIEADVTDYESPTLMMAAATSTDALKEEFNDIDEFSSIFDKLDDLKEATQELIDGTSSLYDGAVKLNDGVSTLKDGTSSLLDGTNQLVDGGKTLTGGVNDLSVGANQLEAGLATAVSSNETLVNGTNTITDAVKDTVQQQLRAQTGDDSITLTWDNYSTILTSGISDKVRSDTRTKIRTSIEKEVGTLTDQKFQGILYLCAANGCATEDAITEYLTNNKAKLATASKVEAAKNDAITKLLAETKDYSTIDRIMSLAVYTAAVDTVQKDYPTLTCAQAETAWLAKAQNPNITAEELQQAIANAPENPKGIDDQTVSNIISVMRAKDEYNNATIYAGLCEKLSNLSTPITDSSQQAIFLTVAGMYYQNESSTSFTSAFEKAGADATVANAINDAFTKANTDKEAIALVDGMINSLISNGSSEALTALQGAAALRSGIKQYTDGVASAYAGSKELTAGLGKLTTGVSSLNAGIQKLNNGAVSLNDGVATLKDGSNTLADGAKTLKEGMVKYNDEAISKLTESTRITSLQEASNLLTAMSESEDNYNNYSGISEGTDGSIKFVFKIEGSKATKKEDTTTETTTEKVSFWQRILNLFKH